MKRPAFQFYAKDWRGNLKLRRCSDAAKGAWIEIMCVLHDSEEYGVARFPLKELVAAAGVQAKSARELVEKGVLKGGDRDVEPYLYTPRHAGKKLPSVTLLDASKGPMWYCSRFVRDEYIRGRRGSDTRFDADNQPPKPGPKSPPKESPKPPFGERQGDGSAVAVASAVNTQGLEVDTSRDSVAKPPRPNRPEAGTAQPRGAGPWRRDPDAALRKLTELGVPTSWSTGKGHDECVERITQELAKHERAT
jgi:hypothetical protein